MADIEKLRIDAEHYWTIGPEQQQDPAEQLAHWEAVEALLAAEGLLP